MKTGQARVRELPERIREGEIGEGVEIGRRPSAEGRLFLASLALTLLATPFLPPVAEAQLQPSCPGHVWMGNRPSDSESPDWSEQAQGVANDGSTWFFTHNELGDEPDDCSAIDTGATLDGSMIQYTKNWRGVDGDDEGKIASVKIPQFLVDQGLWHWGDPDYWAGYVFVPLEGCGPRAVIAVFRASDLAFVDWIDLTPFQPKTGWVAIDPVERTLYTSDDELVAGTPLLRYDIDLAKIEDGISENFLGTPPTEIEVRDPDGGPVAGRFLYMQGGVFTPWGDLYLSVGKAGEDDEDVRGGLHLFRRTDDGAFQLIESSVNPPLVSYDIGDPVFWYKYVPGITGLGEEPEGIDWWNQDNDPHARYPGQLHAILLDNQIDDDNIWLKHYQVPYYCMQGLDSDGDGVDDWDEVYRDNTHPYLVDSDGDGRENGIDNCPLDANPSQADLDGDGLGDVCDDDADGDGQADTDEIACGSDPLDGTSLAPDLDSDFYPDCVDPDDDGDGQTDEDELACGSDPRDASSLSPDFDGDALLDCLDPDDDNDGVDDGDDVCPGTLVPDPVIPTSGELGENRYALVDGDLLFDGALTNSEEGLSLSTTDTGGCNASQIADQLGLGAGHYRFGLSRGVLVAWLQSLRR